MLPREPLSRYWFINQLAAKGMLAKIDEEGWITRPLRPHASPTVSVYRGPPVPLRSPAVQEAFERESIAHGKPDWWW